MAWWWCFYNVFYTGNIDSTGFKRDLWVTFCSWMRAPNKTLNKVRACGKQRSRAVTVCSNTRPQLEPRVRGEWRADSLVWGQPGSCPGRSLYFSCFQFSVSLSCPRSQPSVVMVEKPEWFYTTCSCSSCREAFCWQWVLFNGGCCHTGFLFVLFLGAWISGNMTPRFTAHVRHLEVIVYPDPQCYSSSALKAGFYAIFRWQMVLMEDFPGWCLVSTLKRSWGWWQCH